MKTGLSQENSSPRNTGDNITATRLEDFNDDLTDLYANGNDRGRVVLNAVALKIDIGAFAWRVGTTSGVYAGGTGISVTNSATNYIEIDDTGTIQINTTAWDANNSRIAKVICAGGVVASIEIWKPDVIGGELGGSERSFVGTQTRTSESTKKSISVTGSSTKEFKIVIDTINTSAGNNEYDLQINGLTAGSWYYRLMQATAFTTVNGGTQLENSMVSGEYAHHEIIMQGATQSNNKLYFGTDLLMTAPGKNSAHSGYYNFGASTNLSSIEMFSRVGTHTATMSVYERTI